MTKGVLTPDDETGPASYVNFRAADKGDPCMATVEVFLYSDVRFVDEVREGVGPVSLINPIRLDEGHVAPAIILRYGFHVTNELPQNMSWKPDLSRFTGTSAYDEIACLLALQYGTRLVAGDAVRIFDQSDPLGRPFTDRSPPNVYLSVRRPTPVLPWCSGEKRMVSGHLPYLGRMRPADALALIRSARSYRDALWLADADPQLAWLLLVSAVETAAVHLAIPDEDDAEARLRDAAPQLADVLDSLGPNVASQAAPHLAHLFKATARFLTFFKQFPPPPPEKRPPEGFRFRPWEQKMKKALTAVYEWRSKALHAGVPFPPPMCGPPFPTHPDWNAPCETVIGTAASMQGGVWTREQMPFGLHLFEHIARSSLLAWWKSLIQDDTNAA